MSIFVDLSRRAPRAFLAALLPLPVGAWADPIRRDVAPARYNLIQLKQLAREHNPTLRQAMDQVKGEEGKALQAGLWPNPTIGYLGEQIGLNGTAGEYQGGYLQQRIVLGGKLGLSRQKYEARADAARNYVEAQRLRVENDVETSFYEALGADVKLQIYDELLGMAKDEYKTTEELANIGKKTQADLKMASVKLQKARLDRFMAENERRNQRGSLGAVLGFPVEAVVLEGKPDDQVAQPLPDWEALLQRTLEKSPQILAALDKLRSDEITVSREEAEPIPDLVLEGGAGSNNIDHQVVYRAGLSLEIPLFDRNQGTIQQAKADLERQRGEVERLRLRLTRDFASEYSQFLTEYQRVLDYQDAILPRSLQAYDMKLKMYKVQRIDWTDVLETQEEYLKNRLEWIDYLVEFQRHRVAVQGFLLKDGLTAPENPDPPGHIDAVPKPR